MEKQYQSLIKNCKGRPSGTNIKTDEKYFINYYHQKKEYIPCVCGAMVMKHSISRHMKRSKHLQALELKEKIEAIQQTKPTE